MRYNRYIGTILNLKERRKTVYLTVKQKVKHLSKEEYNILRELCHTAKNLANEAIYNVRQYYFTEGEYLRIMYY